MNTVDVVDYFPQLQKEHPQAIAVYATLKHFCNKKGQCDISLEHVATNLSLEAVELKTVCEILAKYNLLIKQPQGFLINMEPKRRDNSTKLADYAFGDVIPNGYEVLIDQQQMYRCFTTNGLALWKILASICHFFNLDYYVARRLMDNTAFREKFIEIRKSVETAAQISGMKVTKRVLKKGSDKTVSEQFEQLMNEVHLKNEHEIPRHEWKSAQLLRFYCLLYHERYKQHYTFTRSPFGSLEQKAMKTIYEAFDEKAEEAIAFLQWCFDIKSHEDSIKYPLNPAFCSHDRVVREYKTRDATNFHVKPKVTSNSELIPTPFIAWVQDKYPHIQEMFALSKHQDLVWMKKAKDENQLPHPDLEHVLKHAIAIGLLNG